MGIITAGGKVLVIGGRVASRVSGASPPSGATVATLDVTTAGRLTFGLALPEGVATGGVKVGALSTQTDVKKTWNDGSIRYAIVTAHVTDTGSVNVVADEASAAAGWSPTWPTAFVSFTIAGGSTYVATLPSVSTADEWLNGPLVREERVVTTPLTGGSTPHGNVKVVWYVRAYVDGAYDISVRLVNGDVTDATATAVLLSAFSLTVDGSTVYSVAGANGTNSLTGTTSITSTAHGLVKGDVIQLTSGAQSGEYRLVQTVGSADAFTLMTGFSGAQSGATWRRVVAVPFGGSIIRRTGLTDATACVWTVGLSPYTDASAVPPFKSSVTAATYTTANRQFDAGGVGDYRMPINDGGGTDGIGFYPEWCVEWMVHQTAALKSYMEAMADQAATFGLNYHGSDGLALIKVTDSGKAHYWLDSRASSGDKPANNMAGGIPHGWDAAHCLSPWFIPYLFSGRREWLDMQKGQVSQSILSSYDDGTNTPTNWYLRSTYYVSASVNGARGWGWLLRNMADLAAYVPDDDPDEAYFSFMIETNLTRADTHYTSKENALDAYATSLDQYRPNKSISGTDYRICAIWENAYLAFGLDRAILHGFAGGTLLREGIAQFQMNLYNNHPDYDRDYLAPYEALLGVAPNLYTTWADVYTATRLSASNEPRSASSYLAEARYVCQIARRLGLSNAQAAIDYIEATSGFLSGLNTSARWAIEDF